VVGLVEISQFTGFSAESVCGPLFDSAFSTDIIGTVHFFFKGLVAEGMPTGSGILSRRAFLRPSP
jgi:hypothetical protein